MQNIIYKNLHNCRKHNLKRLFGSENISYKTQTEFQISFRDTFIFPAGLIVSISSPHSTLGSKHLTEISWYFCVSDLAWVLFPMAQPWHGVWGQFVWYLILTVSWLWHDTGLTGGQNVTIITRQGSSLSLLHWQIYFTSGYFPSILRSPVHLDSQQIKI